MPMPAGGRFEPLGAGQPDGTNLQRQDPRFAWHAPEHRRPDVEQFSPYAADGRDNSRHTRLVRLRCGRHDPAEAHRAVAGAAIAWQRSALPVTPFFAFTILKI